MSISLRLKAVLDYSGLSLRAFSIKCGISQPTLDKQIKGLRGVSIETITSVLNTYPDISSEWLIRGTGNMLTADNEDANIDRVMKLVDTITTLQESLNAKTETIATLNERIKQLENQLKLKQL